MSLNLAMVVALNLVSSSPIHADFRNPASRSPDWKASTERAPEIGRSERGAPPPAAPRSGRVDPCGVFASQTEARPEAGTEAGDAATLRLYEQAHRGF